MQLNPSGLLGLLFDRFLELPRNIKQSLLLVTDLLMVPLALWLTMVFRLGGDYPIQIGLLELAVCTVTILVTSVAFLRLGLYRSVIRFMGHQAIVAIIKGVTISALTLALMAFVSRIFMPRSVPFIYWSLLLVMAGATRLTLRSYYHYRLTSDGLPVAIYGAGQAGRELLHALMNGERYLPVLFVDDNPGLHGTVISGVPVEAPQHLGRIVERRGIKQLFLAIAAVDEPRRREIINELVELPVYVRTIPTISELMAGNAQISELRDISLEELLGRDPLPPRLELLHRSLGGRCVMVTGAGGSIGAELCRQIVAAEPKELLLFEQSEFALYSIDRELREAVLSWGGSINIVPLLGNVQDERRLALIMRRFGVSTVFHAAAYKHVPLVEHNVVEGILNNVFGTEKAARAAIDSGVERFVLISSDKAVRPTNVMGASKRLAERVLQALATEPSATCFTMVRFGNVLGSSGSVVPLFREQIHTGGPITLTHNDVQRYFMTIPEAAQLVLQVGAMGQGGDLLVLDMGQPIRIAELARRMISLMGRSVRDETNPDGDIEIHLTGLRPGEKLYEELLIDGNAAETGHPMILRAEEARPDASELLEQLKVLRQACDEYDLSAIRAVLAKAVHGYSVSQDPVDELARRTAPNELSDSKVTVLYPRREH